MTEEPREHQVRVDWEEARAANLANWDDRAALHAESYGLEAFLDDPGRLSQVVSEDLEVLAHHLPGGTVRGLDVLHLQCHIGTDTLSLARAGARTTGLDFSPKSLAVAQRLAHETGADITWVCSDVKRAREAVDGDFDVVYTSIGALCWIDDLSAWARQVQALLRPGGVLYVRDGHPMMYTLDDTADHLSVGYRYFGNGLAQAWDDEGTYSGDGTVAHPRSYEWPHPVGELIGSALAAGLAVERFDEGRTLPWRFSPLMEETEEGFVWPGALADRMPCTFTMVARRPAVGS